MRASLQHIATFYDHALYVGNDNKWALKSGSQWCDTPALQAQDSLLWLPLLEYNYREVHAALRSGLTHASPEQAAQRLDTFPVLDLLRLAMTSRSSWYWVELALGWASQVELASDLRRVVQALALDPTVPQPTRHRAKRLWHTGK
jgi:hypothetical protein